MHDNNHRLAFGSHKDAIDSRLSFCYVAVLITEATTSPEGTGDRPFSIAVGDYNLDGSLDLATNFTDRNIKKNTCGCDP